MELRTQARHKLGACKFLGGKDTTIPTSLLQIVPIRFNYITAIEKKIQDCNMVLKIYIQVATYDPKTHFYINPI